MDKNWAIEHLLVIRTLMERSALYRLALAPTTLLVGVIGAAAAALGYAWPVTSARGFIGYWLIVALVAMVGAFLIVRKQALRAAEPFWSLPTRRVTGGMLPPLLLGLVAGVVAMARTGWDFIQPWSLPILWMMLYGCSLNAAGFFMERGIRLFGWMFILCGTGLLAVRTFSGSPLALPEAHLVMGAVFGGMHLGFGMYLYFTEKRERTA